MRKSIYLLAPVTLGVLISACTKPVQREIHEAEVKPRSQTQLEVSLAKLDQWNSVLAQVHAELGSSENPKDFAKLYQLLQPYVLSETVLRDPQLHSTENFRTSLTYLNRILTQWSQQQPKDATALSSALKNYHSVASSGCDEQLRGCLHLSLFRQDFLSSEVLVKYLQNFSTELAMTQTENKTATQTATASSLKEFYRGLRMAYTVKNQRKNPELDYLYLFHARQYAELLTEGSTELQSHGKMFQSLLESFDWTGKEKAFQAFVAQQDTWRFSRKEQGRFPYGSRELFASAAKYLLYDSSSSASKKTLSSRFVESLNEIQKAPDSIVSVLNQLKTADTSVISAMNIDHSQLEIAKLDEYFYILDRLCGGHIAAEEALAIWKVSEKSVDRLAKWFELYTKVRLAEALAYTHTTMAKYYVANSADGENLLKNVLDNSQHVSLHWARALEGIQAIGQFAAEQASKQVGSGPQEDQIKMVLASIDRNMKYIGVYPQMFLLSYIMAEKGATMNTKTWWGAEVKIQAATIIENLLNGTLWTWFRFGNSSDSEISKYEMNYAFYFLVATDLFKKFQNIKGADGEVLVSYEKFFQTLTRKYLAFEIKTMDDGLEKFQAYKNADSKYEQAIRYCRSLSQQRTPIDIGDLEDLIKNIASGVGDSTETSIANSLLRVYSDLEAGIMYVLPKVRLETQFKINQLEDMFNSYEKHNPGNPALKAVKQEIVDLQKKISSYYEMALATHREIHPCLKESLRTESHLRERFIRQEIERLGLIYEGAKQLVLTKASEDQYTQLSQRKELGINAQLEEISPSGYTMGALNTLLRVADYARNHEEQSVRVQLPQIDLTRHRLFQERRLVGFFNEKGTLLSKSEFIKSALKSLNGSQGSFIKWYSNPIGVGTRLDLVNSMAELYKMSYHLKTVTAQSVTATEVLNEYKDLVAEAHLQTREIDLLSNLSLERKIDANSLARFFNIEDNNKATPFDYLFEALVANKTMNSSADRIQEEALDLYQFTSKNWMYLFKAPDQVIKEIRAHLMPLFANAEIVSEQTLKAIQNLEAQKTLPWGEDAFRFRLKDEAGLWKPKQDGAQTWILLSREISQNHWNQKENFHKKTEGQFRQKETL